ncbi:MAG: hypothetical protein C4567_14200 [Deltaproteobacteria bacterium]|nr:MAG: hypothetical protein C4567_14200 [Deltaproteobacteria bacterium]
MLVRKGNVAFSIMLSEMKHRHRFSPFGSATKTYHYCQVTRAIFGLLPQTLNFSISYEDQFLPGIGAAFPQKCFEDNYKI